jgi:plastocyanin
MKTKRWKVLVCLGVLAMLGSATEIRAHYFAAPGAPGEPEAIEIKIDNFSFMPQDMTVAVGTTVTWVNRDDIPHNVRSTDDLFKSKALDTDDKFSFKFDKPGTYAYYCSIHPKMTAKIIVK